MTIRNIERLYSIINRSIFRIDGTLDYDRVTDATIKLANAVADYDGETEDWLYIGEGTECDLSEFIVGAYWHYTEWHAGQSSASYAALCALGRVFSPGMSSVESDNPAYQQLEALCGALLSAISH